MRALNDVAGAERGRDYEIEGRLDLAAVASRVPLDACDVYLCGPGGFMAALVDGVRGLGVPEERLRTESFDSAEPASWSLQDAIAEGSVAMAFAPSGAEALWTPEAGSLLEAAEAAGLSLAFGCRPGCCGSCRARVLECAVA